MHSHAYSSSPSSFIYSWTVIFESKPPKAQHSMVSLSGFSQAPYRYLQTHHYGSLSAACTPQPPLPPKTLWIIYYPRLETLVTHFRRCTIHRENSADDKTRKPPPAPFHWWWSDAILRVVQEEEEDEKKMLLQGIWTLTVVNFSSGMGILWKSIKLNGLGWASYYYWMPWFTELPLMMMIMRRIHYIYFHNILSEG